MQEGNRLALLYAFIVLLLIQFSIPLPVTFALPRDEGVKKDKDYLAPPAQIDLNGSTRTVLMNSAMGQVRLRWLRSVEQLFGRTPERAMADAAQAVHRTISQPGFPIEFQRLTLPWEVVFMDESLPEKQIPSLLVSNCHPAWMTPLANVYVVGQRVVAGCSGLRPYSSSYADGQLAHILIHELGHGIELQLTKGLFPEDRVRAEGFATWFEQVGADYSSVLGTGEIRKQYHDAARRAYREASGPREFKGTLEDYVLASMYFEAIVDKRGVAGLVEIYGTMVSDQIDFFSAVKKRLGWDVKKFDSEIARLLR